MIRKIVIDSREMIENLVYIKSYEKSGFLPNMEEFNLKEFYQLKKQIFSKNASDKQIELMGECHLYTEQIVSEESSLSRIVDNLLSNAIKFSPPGKKLWFDLNSGDDKVIFTIRDEGPRIQFG